jgi:hypothetical protein
MEMMKTGTMIPFKSAIAMACLAAVAFAAAWTSAQTQAQIPGLQGTYVNASQSNDPIDAAIQASVARMNFITRPIARSRLRKTNPAFRKIEITLAEQEISVAFDAGKPVRMPADGSTVQWTRDDGEVFDVAASWRGEQLVQSFKATDGQRINTFELSPDGKKLTLQVELTSPQLPSSLNYVLSFSPQPAR